jgi:hypothetical protein
MIDHALTDHLGRGGGGVKSRLIRSLLINGRLGNFFSSHFKWISSLPGLGGESREGGCVPSPCSLHSSIAVKSPCYVERAGAQTHGKVSSCYTPCDSAMDIVK